METVEKNNTAAVNNALLLTFTLDVVKIHINAFLVFSLVY